MNEDIIQINPADNVAVVLEDFDAGRSVVFNKRLLTVSKDIPFGHKIALSEMNPGDKVIKYGSVIGRVTANIKPGDHVHSHNMATNLDGILSYSYTPYDKEYPKTNFEPDWFLGYERKDGRVGVRNELWIVPTVSCINQLVQQIATEARKRYPNLGDGIFAMEHNAGCSQLGDDMHITQALLSGIIHHPNAGGVLLVSLGCENNDFDHFMPVLGKFDEIRVQTMIAQEVTGNEIETAMEKIKIIADKMKNDSRTVQPVSKLKIGLKCGASDAFSGITSNPLCGLISETLINHGGSSILTEVPEMFGAEEQLMSRARDEKTFQKIVKLINQFKEYFISHNQPIYENPAPGNKAGGITTLEEKSLGCIQKGGIAYVADTLDMGEPCTEAGINLLYGPGNDSVAITNLLCSGAQIILFTTGRGNPLGTYVPTIKISSNSRLSEQKNNWIDFDAGCVLNGVNMQARAKELWKLVIAVASGKQFAKNETNGYRQIMIFKNGVML